MRMNQELREAIKLQELGNDLRDGTALSWLFCYQATQSQVAPVVNREEMEILRNLARQVARLAELPVQEERKKLWSDHHSLKITKPPIFIDPEYAWYELIPHTQLQCKNNLARIWEYRLRKEIFWQEQIGDDRVCTKEFPVCHVFHRTGFGIDLHNTESHKRDGAYHIDTVLSDWDDMGKLHHRDLIIDYETTDKILELAHENGRTDADSIRQCYYMIARKEFHPDPLHLGVNTPVLNYNPNLSAYDGLMGGDVNV